MTPFGLLNSVEPVLASRLAGVAVPLVAYSIGLWVQQRSGRSTFANPSLIGIVFTAAVALLLPEDCAAFREGANSVFFIIGPATVAFAVPLYRNRTLIKESARRISCAIAFGAVMAALFGTTCAWALGLPRALILSVAPKSTTAAFAIGISEHVGGLPALTAVIVMLTGLTTAVSATMIFDRIGVRDLRARGLAAGICGHALATARMFQIDETMGAFASLAIGLTGIGTALCVPLLAALLFP
jgi:putative effector of murein hydrolase